MIGGDLFQRIFLRSLMGLVAAFLVFLPLVHVFQQRFVFGEWREDLRQEARWLALHSRPDMIEALANAWRTTHSTIRLTIFAADGQPLGDSQPEHPLPDLDLLRQGSSPPGYLAVVETVPRGGWLVMSRPSIPL